MCSEAPEDKIYTLSKCVRKAGKVNISRGDAWKQCVKSIYPGMESVRHGYNPNLGMRSEKIELTEAIKYNIINGTNTNIDNKRNGMSFKNRLLQENYQDKIDNTYNNIKTFVGNNKGLTGLLGGAATGALYNSATDGASDLESSINRDIEEVPENIKQGLIEKRLVPQEGFNRYLNNYQNATDTQGVIQNTVGDILSYITPGANTDTEAVEAMKSASIADNRFGSNEGKVDGYSLNPNISQEDNWRLYNNKVTTDITDTDIQNNSDYKNSMSDLQNRLSSTTSDSYMKATAVGAGAGALGSFAKRKYDQKNS